MNKSISIISLLGAVFATCGQAHEFRPVSGVPSGIGDGCSSGVVIEKPVGKYRVVSQPEVVSRKILAGGLVELTMRDSSGNLMKQYQTCESGFRVGQSPSRMAREVEATGLNESFEGYNGVDSDWIPAGWSENSLVGYNGEGRNHTWHVTGATGGLVPSHGKYHAVVEFSDSAQDEWLVSPTFVAQSGTRLYADVSLSLFSIYDAEYFDTETQEFSKRKVTATLACNIWHDGAWEEVWNARDLAARLSDGELWTGHSGFETVTARIPLSDYAGKEIKIAFRYVGSAGNSMAVDNVAVGVANNMAVYRRPQGFFFEGMSCDYSADLNYAALVGPAYTDALWRAAYTRDVESLEWEFSCPDDLDSGYIDRSWMPVTNYGYCVSLAPSVTAKSDGLPDLKYSYDIANKAQGIVKYGGGGTDLLNARTVYGCGSYNWRCGLQGPVFSDTPGDYIFGPTSNEKFWKGAGISLISIASYYEKPLSPYWFDKLWIFANDLEADDDAEFTLNIYRIGDDGYIENSPFASSTVKAGDFLKYSSDSGYLYTLLFPFDEITVTDAILVELKGFMDTPKVRVFSPVMQYNPHVDVETNGYMFYSRNGQTMLAGTSTVLSNFWCPFLFTMNATYPFLISDGYEYAAPDEGGEHIFEIDSYYYSSSWSIDEDIPEWVDIFESVEESGADGFVSMGLRVGVKPLVDVAGRSWDFTLRVPGLERKFRISQGDVSGIDYTVGTVESPQVVSVHNLDGRACAPDLSSLGRGMYIVRYSDGTTKKIIK